jgi:acyl-CoA dehydrogenase
LPFHGGRQQSPLIANATIYPVSFAPGTPGAGAAAYRADPAVQRLAEFFEHKGLAALKKEDRHEAWYDDWIEYQAKYGLYAWVMSPRAYSTRGCEFDLLKLTRFWETAAYFSPAHAYSLHVSFLGLFAILRGGNEPLKREAVASLEAGGIFAFGVSEQEHGADLLGNEFTVTELAPGRLLARGSKYYIGNANSAAMISVLAKRARGRHDGASRRAPLLFFALRSGHNGALRGKRKIRTMGIRSAYVGAFDVYGHEFPEADVISDGRDAWETVFATVTLGKFFLCFGSIGMCEHALEETRSHTSTRVLYGRPVGDMPHIRAAMAHAYAKLTAMKLFAYRGVDYLHAARADDRRYLLFASVQKARVSSEGVKVMALLSECIGARGFEADTYFESALRDVPMVPVLEGSTHINHQVVAQFLRGYFAHAAADPPASPPSLAALGAAAGENPYLMETLAGDAHLVRFAHCLAAYRPLMATLNVSTFVTQVRAFRLFVRRGVPVEDPKQDAEVVIALGKCLSVIAYGQLVAEHSVLAAVPAPLVSVLFHHLVEDLSTETMRLAALPQTSTVSRSLLARAVATPLTARGDLDFVADRASERG